jgi:hypothetical protein
MVTVSSSWMATLLDQEQIERANPIAPRSQSVLLMPDRSGVEVSAEIGGRFLVRYLAESQVSAFQSGSTDRDHWVTTTAISPSDVVSWLALFAPRVQRKHALILDPSKIATIRGPAWIRLGQGIEYYLPAGFPQDAICGVGVIPVR